MADRIRVNTARLGTDADRIQSYINSIIKEVSNMRDSVAQLETMWEGLGSQAFHKTFRDDIEAMETIIGNLKNIYTYEKTAKQEYERCRGKVSSMVAEIKV